MKEAVRSLKNLGLSPPKESFLGEWASRYPVVWLVPVALVIQTLPVPWFLPTLRDPGRAEVVIGTVVGVVGSVLALALAVILFTAQAFYGSRYARYGGSLTQFVEVSGLTWTLSLGVTALVTGGLSLASQRAGGPWPSTWVLIVSSAFILSLPILFWKALEAIDPRRIDEWRLGRIRHLTGQQAWSSALMHLASQAVLQRCEVLGIKYQPLTLGGGDTTILRAPASGYVADLNLQVIEQLAERARSGEANVTLLKLPGDSVQDGEPLVMADRSIDPGESRGLIKLADPPAQEPLELLDELHTEGLDAVRSAQPTWYESVAQAYSEYVLGGAQRLAQVGLSPDIALQSADWIFARTPLRRLSQYLYEELVEAATGRGREVAFEAIYLPTRIANDATRLGAEEVFSEMVRLYPAVYASLQQAGDPPLEHLMRDRIRHHLLRIIEHPLVSEIRGQSDGIRVDRLASMIQKADAQVAELIRNAINLRDTETVHVVVEEWLDTLGPWRPEHSRPHPWEIETLKKSQGESEELLELENRLGADQHATMRKREVLSSRRRWLFGLAMWALRAVRDEPGHPGARMFLELEEKVGGVLDLFATARDALVGGASQWFSSWVMLEVPRGRIHVGGADAELEAAFVAALLVRADQGGAIDLPPAEWLPPRLDRLLSTLEELHVDQSLMAALAVSDPEAAQERVADVLRSSAQAQEELEAEAERRLEVPDEAIQILREQTKASWNESRLVSRLFELLDRIRPSSDPNLDRWTMAIRYPKNFLQLERRDDLKMFGEELGLGLSRGEIKALTKSLSTSPHSTVSKSEVSRAVTEALTQLRESDYEPNLILLPVDWRLHSQLGLDWLPEGHPEPPEWMQLTSNSIAQHLGEVDGVPSFYSAEIPENRVLIVGLQAFGSWLHPSDLNKPMVEVTVEEFNGQDAASDLSPDEILEKERTALVVAIERLSIQVDDAMAARVIQLSAPTEEEE